MDRVLLACDQIQYSAHIEMTLRKVGYDVETMTTEYNLSERLLTFNPDIIIVRGNSPKLMTLNMGIKLKEQLKYHGRLILIFSSDYKLSPDDLTRIKVDLLLFEPIGALKLAMQILNLDPEKKEMMQDRLLRLAETDQGFRAQEQAYLVQHNLDIAQEIIQVQGKVETGDQEFYIDENVAADFTRKKTSVESVSESKSESLSKTTDPVENKPVDPVLADEPIFSADYQNEVKNELEQSDTELPLRIDTYNHSINNIDQDLKKGLKKRQTTKIAKELRKELMVDPGQEKLDSLDAAKRNFANALFKKKK